MALTRFVLITCLLSAAACRKQPAPTPPAPTVPPWKTATHEVIDLPVPADAAGEWFRTETGGSWSFAATTPGALAISVTAMPVTSMHLAAAWLLKAETERLAPLYKANYPALKAADVRLVPVDGKPGEVRLLPTKLAAGIGTGRIWFDEESASLVLLLVGAPSEEDAEHGSVRIREGLRVKRKPVFPISKRAAELTADVPKGWELVADDARKRYWAREDGQAFFMISKGTPNPLAEERNGYGTTEEMGRVALETVEKTSGRKAEITASTLLFDDRLYLPISKAAGKVEYKSAQVFAVEMEFWYDPRLRKAVRVYLGGRTDADVEAARAIRRTLGYRWAE